MKYLFVAVELCGGTGGSFDARVATGGNGKQAVRVRVCACPLDLVGIVSRLSRKSQAGFLYRNHT